jgi:hypothetical protein
MQVQPSLISPAENFDLFYFLRNPTDNTTYYVQAVIYDLRTGEVLLTTPLDQTATNAHLFVKTVQAPPDSRSIGRNIVAIASVYTDSTYATKSDAYEEQEQYFLIKAQLPNAGAVGVDYPGLRAMMEEVVAKAMADNAPKETEPPPMPFDALFGTLGALQREINRIPKEAPETDLAPIQSALSDIRAAIAALPAPTPATDLSHIHDALTQLEITVSDGIKTDIDSTKYLEGVVGEKILTLSRELRAALVQEVHAAQPVINISKGPSANQPTPSPLDLSHLTG